MDSSILMKLALSIVGVVVVFGLLWAAMPRFRRLAKRWRPVIIFTFIAHDLVRRWGLNTTQVGQDLRPAPSDTDVDVHLQRINRTFEDYRQFLKAGDYVGKHLLEVGTGFNLGVALRFIAAGAASVAGWDKFVPLQTGPFYRRLYERLRETLSPEEQIRFDSALDLSTGVGLKPEKLLFHYGRSIADLHAVYGAPQFDLIVSHVSLGEVAAIDETLAALDRVLKPEGMQVHKLDLRDEGVFSNYGFHPLEFLTVSDRLYRLMSEASGQPNRRMAGYYRETMTRLGYHVKTWTTLTLYSKKEFVPPKEVLQKSVDYPDEFLDGIAQIRPRLLPRFQALTDDELLTQGILLVATKGDRPVLAV